MGYWSSEGIIRESEIIQEKLLAAQSRQKEYAYRKVRDLDFIEGESVMQKVSPVKGVVWFGGEVRLVQGKSDHLKFLTTWGRWSMNWPYLQGYQKCT